VECSSLSMRLRILYHNISVGLTNTNNDKDVRSNESNDGKASTLAICCEQSGARGCLKVARVAPSPPCKPPSDFHDVGRAVEREINSGSLALGYGASSDADACG
jgi:hypothetical protein